MRTTWRLAVALSAGVITLVASLLTAAPAGAIVGGTAADPANYPYFVSVGSPYTPACGGSVIAADWVLTAAHCVDPPGLLQTYGTVNGSRVAEIIPHPLWDGNASHGHDLALVRSADGPFLDRTPVQVGSPWDPGAYAPTTPATIMGYGSISGSHEPSDGFLTSSTWLHSDGDMADLWSGWIGPMMIGAGSSAHNICYGDSGGPLVVNRNGHPVEVGVADFGNQDCSASAFAELSGPQLAWIATTIPAVAERWNTCPLDGGAVVGAPKVAYSTTSFPGAATDGPFSWVLTCVPQAPGFQVALRSSADGLLWEESATGGLRRVANGLGLAVGTSPAIAGLSSGGRVMAFHANGSDNLWVVTADNIGHDTGVPMAAGSSPAITALPDGGYEIAFANADNYLRELGPDGVVRWAANGLGVSPGTSPGIAAGPRGGFEIAFHAWGVDTLWTVTPDNIGHDTTQPIAASTSPGIAGLANGTFEIAFADSAGYPRRLGPDNVPWYVTLGFTVAPNTGVGIAARSGGGYTIAVHGGAVTNTLWTFDEYNNAHDTGVSMALGTSPAIAALPAGGVAIAVQADTGRLWTVGVDGKPKDTTQTLTAGSGPAIASARVGGVIGYAGKCMDVAGANPASGTRVQLWTCNGTNAQTWTVAPDATFRAMGKCLDVAGGSTADNAKIQLWDCNGTGAQVWQSTTASELRNPQSGKCLDVTGASSNNGAPLQLFRCNTGANQKWFLPPDSSAVIAGSPTSLPAPVVPDVVGDSLTDATSTVQVAGLVVGAVDYKVDNLCDSINLVMHQSPAPGTQVVPGSAVSVTIGTKPANCL